jgi:hypothetical protein
MNKYNRGGAVQAHRIKDDGELKDGNFRIDDLTPRKPQRLNWWKPMQVTVPQLSWVEPRHVQTNYWCRCGNPSYAHPIDEHRAAI